MGFCPKYVRSYYSKLSAGADEAVLPGWSLSLHPSGTQITDCSGRSACLKAPALFRSTLSCTYTMEEETQLTCSFVTKLPAELRIPEAPLVLTSSHACCNGTSCKSRGQWSSTAEFCRHFLPRLPGWACPKLSISSWQEAQVRHGCSCMEPCGACATVQIHANPKKTCPAV